MYKTINSKQLIKDCLITFDYIDSKQRLNNFGIKKRFFPFYKYLRNLKTTIKIQLKR